MKFIPLTKLSRLFVFMAFTMFISVHFVSVIHADETAKTEQEKRIEKQKKAQEAKKKQKTVDIKEIKLRPRIDKHDLEIKMRNVHKFLDAGDKVKFTLRFRGREMAHQELGAEVLQHVKEELGEKIRVEHEPKTEGRVMIMVVAPK